MGSPPPPRAPHGHNSQRYSGFDFSDTTGEAWGALRAAPPATIASIVYLGVFPGAIAWVTLGEAPTLLAILGGVPIVAGVALVNRGRRSG